MSDTNDRKSAPRITDYEGLSGYLGLPKATLRARVGRGDIPFLRFGPRLVRFDLDAIDTWVASCRNVPAGSVK